MYEAIENIDFRQPPGRPIEVRKLGSFEQEQDAIAVCREARERFLAEGYDDYAWWLVRKEGNRISTWIADSLSDDEMILDMRSGQLFPADRRERIHDE